MFGFFIFVEIVFDFYIKQRYKENMQLNTQKIINELKRIGKSKGWLAKKIGKSNATVSYILKSKKITHAERIGGALGIEPKDLIL